MAVLPIVSRELLVQARRKSAYWIRVLAAAAAGFLMLWLLVIGSAPIPTLTQGKTLFTALSIVAFIYCLFIGVLVTADCLSAEKRDGTIGLIFLTHLKGYDVVLGKLASSSLHAVYGLLAAVPMMSVTLLLGGVTAGEITRTTLVLLNTLFFSLSAGMFVSTLSHHDRKAAFATVLLVLIIAAGPYEAAYFLMFRSGGALNEIILAPSPAYALILAQGPLVGPLRSSTFYGSLAATLAISWGLLILSCAIIPHVCKDRPKGPRGARLAERWRQWRFVSGVARAEFRRRLLDRNPLFWLSSRERFKAFGVWFLNLPLAALGLWIYFKYSLAFYEAALLLVFTVHVLLKIWFAGEVANRWIEDRRCGALELLLCAPLQVKDLVCGQELALWRQFGWPVIVTLGLTLAAWFGVVRANGAGSSTEMGRSWLMMSIPVLVADLVALRWVGMWLGLTARGLNRAIAGAIGRVLFLRWGIFFFCFAMFQAWLWIWLGQASLGAAAKYWLFLALGIDGLFAWSARRKFLAYFRIVAANPEGFTTIARLIENEGARPTDPASERIELTSGQSQIQVARTKRKLTRIAVAAALMLFVIGTPMGYQYWLKWRIESRIIALQKAGIPTSIAELERRRPASLDGVNTADVIDRVFPHLHLLQGFPPLVRTNLPGFVFPGAFQKFNDPLSSAMKQAITTVLSSNQIALAIIHEAPSLASGRYAMDWRSGGNRYQSQSQGVWMVSQLLQCEVFLHSENGDLSQALESLRRLFQLGRSLSREPAPAYQGSALECYNRAFAALQRLMTRHSFSSAQILELEKEIAAARAATDLQQALFGYRCMILDRYRSPAPEEPWSGPPPQGSVERIRASLQKRIRDWTGGNTRDLIAFLDRTDEFVRLLAVPWHERFQRAQRLLPEASQGPIPPGGRYGPAFNTQFIFDFMFGRHAEFEARCGGALTSLAIERFRLEHGGNVPEKLEELVPKWMPDLPRDPFDGQPLRYKRLAKGYRIYSVGKNGVDDGGAEAAPNFRVNPQAMQGDVVFSVER